MARPLRGRMLSPWRHRIHGLMRAPRHGPLLHGPLLHGRLRPWPLKAWPLVLGAALAAGLVARPSAGGTASGSSAQGPAATVQDILDGNQLYIEQRQAKVRDGAKVPDRIRTGDSRAQMAFRAGGTARINRFSQMKLGTNCFFLNQGQVLVSGPQNGCTRSSRMSVRGTNYLISVGPGGQAELTVLEGQVMVEAPSDAVLPADARPTAVFGGFRVSLGRNGTVSDRHRLSDTEMAAILYGPLFQGFLTPLSHQLALQTFLQRAYPNLSFPTPSAVADPGASALQASINSMRLEQGRPPFQSLPTELSARNRAYLKPVLQSILAGASCDHDRSRWREFQDSLVAAGLKPSSEVLTCGTLRDWDPKQVVSEWLSSPVHRAILLERPRATSLGCSTLSKGDDTVAFCTLWTPSR